MRINIDYVGVSACRGAHVVRLVKSFHLLFIIITFIIMSLYFNISHDFISIILMAQKEFDQNMPPQIWEIHDSRQMN